MMHPCDAWLVTESKAVQRRVLKAIGQEVGIPLEFKHIEEILRFAGEEGPAGKELSLPLGWKVRANPRRSFLLRPTCCSRSRSQTLNTDDATWARAVPEMEVVIEALLPWHDTAFEASAAEYNPQQLLRADLLHRR